MRITQSVSRLSFHGSLLSSAPPSNQPTVPERHRSWCWGIIVKHIFTRSIRSTLANWTRMSVMTAEFTTVWVWHSTLDSAFSPANRHYKQQGASGQSFCCSTLSTAKAIVKGEFIPGAVAQHPCRCGRWATWWGWPWLVCLTSICRPTGWPWLHVLPHPRPPVCTPFTIALPHLCCVWRLLLNLCTRYEEMIVIPVQHDISTIVAVQRIPPVIHTSDSEH